MQVKWSSRRFSLILAVALVALLVSSPEGAQTNYPPPQIVTPSYVVVDGTVGSDTVIGGGDDESLQTSLPFPFTFYGVTYNQAFISTNGYLSFLGPSSESFNACSTNYPYPGPPDGSIYAFWDDLIVGQVRTRLLGSTPNRQFVIEWSDVWFFDPSLTVRPSDFEIVLHETGAIVLQFKNVGLDGAQRGNSATVGLENHTGDVASPYSCNTASLGPVATSAASLGSADFAIRYDWSTPPPTEQPPVNVAVDFKPMRCPNWFNVDSRGEVAVAILGTADFNVKDIDPRTVKLEGVAPVRGSWRVRHVGAHVLLVRNTDASQCTARRDRNRHQSVIFKVDRQALSQVLASANHGEVKSLKLNGKLWDGTEISGQDSVHVINKAKKGKKNNSHHRSRYGGYRHDKDDDDDDDRDNDDD